MLEMTMELGLAQGATLGEGLLWHDGRWWWTDIEAATLHAWAPGDAAALNCKLPDRLGSFAHCRSGKVLLGLAKRLCLGELPLESGVMPPLQTLVAVDPAEPRTRINDGRTDRRGFFVFGTINETAERRPIGSFFQFSLQHGLRRLALPAVAIANSICFSPDGSIMYFCDTLTRRIMQCDYEAESARVANVRLFAKVDIHDAWPDGSIIDRDGCLWNAQWGAARVVQYAPDGQVLGVLHMAAKHPTCPAFGGANLDQLMLSTARQDMSREDLEAMPLSGSLFTRSMPQPLGVADTLFDDQ